ncbi:MAG TPA: damage-inducible protein DinB [Leptolyngbyaceae cyanobacterium M33_DOE_097]|uniref:Damage-inducible protein DinB n=1 Tax=Oscillatoriales cyanobacterium SpSt-418 TaxID=2282169 RepID=A0A7C3PD70_9CYAN|nr:damage-inducible protein DinB [Leptolyngbyaceae cyanobacterium M33_DOE_097]
MTSLIQHFQMLAHYNALANQKLYDACAQLSDAERKLIRPAFFKSIHGTLNHIMVGDRIWFGRFAGQEVPSTGLDTILYDNFAELQQARLKEDTRILEFVATLTEAFLAQSITYRNNAGVVHTDPTDVLLAHLFNHQTHHRGQVHDMLSQTEVAPPSLDLHRMLRPSPV